MLNVLWFLAATDGTSDVTTALFTQLGTAGAVAMVLGLWQRDTAKRLDRAITISEAQTPLLIEIRDAMRANSDAHRQSADAQRASAEAMTAMAAAARTAPTEAEVTRLRDALLVAERRLRERDGGG